MCVTYMEVSVIWCILNCSHYSCSSKTLGSTDIEDLHVAPVRCSAVKIINNKSCACWYIYPTANVLASM